MPQQTLDPDAVNLSKAIRQTESGGNFQAKGKSGEYGAYQYTDKTWTGDSAAAGINVPLEQATPEQQNQVAYTKIKSLKDAGNNVGQIASIWNSGKPDAYLDSSYTGTNAEGAKYDVPAYAKSVATAYQAIKQGQQVGVDPNNPSSVGNAQNQPTPNQVIGDQSQPSFGGFGENVIKSGANFLGNLGNAALHPLLTVQNIGSMGVGGLQELGGQQNENTQKFDALKDYFVQKYGGVKNIEHSLYTDPISVLADLSTVFSGAGGAIGLAGKGAELAGVEGAADAANTVGNVAKTAGEYTNPLTPLAKGVSALTSPLQKGATYAVTKALGVGEDTAKIVQDNKEAITSDAISNASFTRAEVAKQVESAFQKKEAEFSDTGAGYTSMKESPTPIKVAPNFLEQTLRDEAGVDINDGQITGSASSKIRATKDINALQQLFNTFKPAFQKGELSPQEFFNFRDDLKNVAKYDREFSASRPVENVAAALRSKFNDTYRGEVPGLKELDQHYGEQAEEIKTLRKGLFDKEGNLLETGINKIANATGKGKDQLLSRLESIEPGITKKIQIQKALEDLQAATKPRVGTYTRSALEAGGVLAGISTGSLHLIGGAVALAIISDPRIAVPLLKAFDFDKTVVSDVSGRLSKYLTLGAVSSNIQANVPDQQTPDITQETVSEPQKNSPSYNDAPNSNNFDTQAALKAGYSQEEVNNFLSR